MPVFVHYFLTPLPHPLTGKMINIAALAFADSHNGNHQLIVYYLINQAKPGCPKFDFVAVFNPT